MSSTPRYAAFAITAPGLERFAAAELEGLTVRDVEIVPGGVMFSASRQLLYAANLHLRTASRVVVRVGDFAAKTFHELERRAGKLPWDEFISPNLTLALRVTCRKSRLYHSDAVAERVASSIAVHVSDLRFIGDSADDTGDAPRPEQLVIVRMFHDRCTVSVDSSGALLHLRGYRLAVGRAPLRETLAAAALMGAEWRVDHPLVDPMCGAGTIPIEAALMARRIPPGRRRPFAFMHWPDFDEVLWRRVISDADSATLPRAPAPILGSDRDGGAIESARANAERAGVSDDVRLDECAISSIEPPAERGWVVTNPPYGVRVGERDRLRNLYAQFGKVLRAKCDGWHVGLVSGAPELERHVGVSLDVAVRTVNGGIPVRIVTGVVSGEAAAGPPAGSPTRTSIRRDLRRVD
jgi:putative N6-adenine-specific DNA methylase